jgi:hypothetical protein
MIPHSEELLTPRETNEVLPTKTYKIDFATKRIIGIVDGRDAVVQFIRKALNTDKYAFEIYNWYYGNEIRKLVGHPYDYVVTRIPNIFREALLVDDRIIDVRDFTFRRTQLDALLVSCVIDTVYGEVIYEQEVVT